jgi:hypothetical protein
VGDRVTCERRAFPGWLGVPPHYESFYLKACRPGGGVGLWLRYTVLKPPGQAPQGALWCTLFDAAAPGPLAVKQELAAARLAVPGGGYIGIGESRFTPLGATGGAAAAGHCSGARSWSTVAIRSAAKLVPDRDHRRCRS